MFNFMNGLATSFAEMGVDKYNRALGIRNPEEVSAEQELAELQQGARNLTPEDAQAMRASGQGALAEAGLSPSMLSRLGMDSEAL